MHPPRLCIDGRAASESHSRGLLVQEVMDQLLSAPKEPDGAEDAAHGYTRPELSAPELSADVTGELPRSWLEAQEPLLLTHVEQAFPGTWHRVNTRLGLRRTPLHWAWERNFLHQRGVTACHRFRPADRLSPFPNCPTLTTLLPPIHGLPFFLSRRPNQSYVIPSVADARLLERNYQIDPERIVLVRPGVRRFVLESAPLRPSGDGSLLILTGGSRDLPEKRKLIKILSEIFPDLACKVLPLQSRTDFSPASWTKLLQGARLCVYLTALPFDWPTLALEALYFGVPVLFPDQNTSLAELLVPFPFKLSRFLVDKPQLLVLKSLAAKSWAHLAEQGIWEPSALGAKYRKLYRANLEERNA